MARVYRNVWYVKILNEPSLINVLSKLIDNNDQVKRRNLLFFQRTAKLQHLYSQYWNTRSYTELILKLH